MALDDVLQKVKEAGNESSPLKYRMFLASKAVEQDREYLDVTNKFTGAVGECISLNTLSWP